MTTTITAPMVLGLRGPGGVVTPELQTLHDEAVGAAQTAEDAAKILASAFTFSNRHGLPALCAEDGRILLYADPETGHINFLPNDRLRETKMADTSGLSFSDNDPTRLYWRTEDGRIIALWDTNGAFDALPSAAFAQRLKSLLDSDTSVTGPDFGRFYLWGDSRTQGAGSSGATVFPHYVTDALPAVAVHGFNADNLGRSGQTSAEIVARQGGRPAVLTVTNSQIPASGPIAVTSRSVDIFRYGGSANGYALFTQQSVI